VPSKRLPVSTKVMLNIAKSLAKLEEIQDSSAKSLGLLVDIHRNTTTIENVAAISTSLDKISNTLASWTRNEIWTLVFVILTFLVVCSTCKQNAAAFTPNDFAAPFVAAAKEFVAAAKDLAKDLTKEFATALATALAPVLEKHSTAVVEALEKHTTAVVEAVEKHTASVNKAADATTTPIPIPTPTAESKDGATQKI
jgi:hypothetical protein